MLPLSLDVFVKAASDQELGKYIVLAALKRFSENFNKSKLFPDLAELSEVLHQLQILRNGKENLKGLLPGPISPIGSDTQSDSAINDQGTSDSFFEFVDWAFPELNEKLNEGKAIYDFVQSNLHLKDIGISPMYDKEGYIIIPDNQNELLQVYNFSLSFLFVSSERSRMLKTKFIRYIEDTTVPGEEIKLELIREFEELPNPVTIKCETDLDFPFYETILPVAKRKLLSRFAA